MHFNWLLLLAPATHAYISSSEKIGVRLEFGDHNYNQLQAQDSVFKDLFQYLPS